MLEILLGVVGNLLFAGLGAWLYKLSVDREEEREFPYKWSCEVDGCGTEMATNDLAFLDERILVHKEQFHNA